MKVFAISDLHLSNTVEKPMDIFGKSWENYIEKITQDWQEKVSDDDIVLLPGDLSWAMRMDEVIEDFNFVASLKGKKVLLRGNHDYWWNTISQVRSALPQNMYALQNDVLRFGKLLLCGTRGWVCPDVVNKLTPQDQKIYLREVQRMQLSIEAMNKQRQPDDVVIAMMHYPPFNARYDQSDFTTQFVKYNIPQVVYGHLHGKDCRAQLYLKKFGIEFFLTSCDLADNKLTLINEID
ncbi:MAG TPA: metallophosphoesterase [Candidatus Limihabitans stercoravium]|nr:metallophosphoesterase [Candidatus Limihabitans stercoravium]